MALIPRKIPRVPNQCVDYDWRVVCRPKHWRRNTAIAMAGIFLVCIPIAMKSAQLEQRPHYPVRPIPSQLWCKNFPEPPDSK